MAIRVSMLAARRRARRAASCRNGQPTQNCTGVASANAASLAHGWPIRSAAPGSIARASTAASGEPTSRRRSHPAAACASVWPCPSAALAGLSGMMR